MISQYNKRGNIKHLLYFLIIYSLIIFSILYSVVGYNTYYDPKPGDFCGELLCAKEVKIFYENAGSMKKDPHSDELGVCDPYEKPVSCLKCVYKPGHPKENQECGSKGTDINCICAIDEAKQGWFKLPIPLAECAGCSKGGLILYDLPGGRRGVLADKCEKCSTEYPSVVPTWDVCKRDQIIVGHKKLPGGKFDPIINLILICKDCKECGDPCKEDICRVGKNRGITLPTEPGEKEKREIVVRKAPMLKTRMRYGKYFTTAVIQRTELCSLKKSEEKCKDAGCIK